MGGYDHSVCAVEVNLSSLDTPKRPTEMRRLFADCDHSAPVRCIDSKGGLLASAGHDETIRYATGAKCWHGWGWRWGWIIAHSVLYIDSLIF